MTRRLSRSTIILLALTLSGCGTNPTPVANPPPVSIRALAPAVYVEQAGSLSLLAIRLSALARDRSTDPARRGFAERQDEEQHAVAAQLSFAGRYIDQLPSARLTADDQIRFDTVGASATFDRDYARAEVELLARGLVLHRAFAAAGTSPTLRPVAEFAVPRFERELAEVRSLR